MKKLILFLLLFFNSFVFTQNNNFINSLDSLLTSDYFKSTQISISVYDLTNDKPVYSKNEKLLFHPASLEKILTTAAALKFLGTGYNFKTKFFHTGNVEDSICSGDLYIVGGFDPVFSVSDLDSAAKEIKNYGIKEIHGNLYADISAGDSLFWGNGWMWDDDPYSFAAYISPLNINENSIKIICKPENHNEPAVVQLIPANNFIDVENNSFTSDTGKTNLTVTRDWLNRSNKIFIKGTISISGGADTTTINIFNPVYFFLNLMKERLEQNGIKFHGSIDTLTLKPDFNEIFSLEHNIDSVIVYTNKNSYNLGAEMILRSIANEYFPKPATAQKGISIVDSLISLSGLDSKNYRIVDGSGLSFYNLVSAELITNILKYFYAEEEELFVKLYNSFPISGFDGTLNKRMNDSPAVKRVHAKTGSISGVNNLAGYITTKNKNILAFSIFIQNYTTGAQSARSIQDKICELIFEEL